MTMRAAVLTISDKGSRGEREDASGPAVCELLKQAGITLVHSDIIPDEQDCIARRLEACCDEMRCDLVVTTGGTGVAPRDVTPEATRQVIERELPGFGEAMRMESLKITPHAVISRAMAGIRGRSLIINLPGSPKAARENLATVLPAIAHTISKIQGDPSDCVL
jgi:molybdenum cofactor synthesis domain-containing protein